MFNVEFFKRRSLRVPSRSERRSLQQQATGLRSLLGEASDSAAHTYTLRVVSVTQQPFLLNSQAFLIASSVTHYFIYSSLLTLCSSLIKLRSIIFHQHSLHIIVYIHAYTLKGKLESRRCIKVSNLPTHDTTHSAGHSPFCVSYSVTHQLHQLSTSSIQA